MENLKKTMKDVLENNILNYWIHKVRMKRMVASMDVSMATTRYTLKPRKVQ